jgi:hypothetical protein
MQYCNISLPSYPFIAKGYEGAYVRGRIRFLKEATTKRKRNRYVHMRIEYKSQEKWSDSHFKLQENCIISQSQAKKKP